MASGGKKKTTMAKLMRESRQRERRQDKLARKEARRLGLAENPEGAAGDDAGSPSTELVHAAPVVPAAELVLSATGGVLPEQSDGS